MAEVVIKLTAESAEALRRMKEFTKGIEDSWTKVRAGDPILHGSSVKIADLTRAKGEAAKASRDWADALGQIPGPLGNVATQTSRWIGLLRGPAGLAVALGAAAAAGVGFAKSMANDIERLDNLTRVTGLSIAALETFEHLAKQAGEAPEGLVQGLGKINTAISDVIKGSEGASKSFQTIGVDLRALVQSGASTEQILEATAKALAAIPDPTRQAAAMADIFGVRSRALQIALQRVATDGIGPLIAEMTRLGIVTSQETIQAAKHVDEMADRFDQTVDRMIKKAKQYAVEAVSDFAKVARITADLLGPGADPAQAGRVVAGQLAHEIVRPGVLTAGPQAPRQTAPTATDLAAAQAATDLALKQQIEANEDIRKAREELNAALAVIQDREYAARAAASEQQLAQQIATDTAIRQDREALQAALAALDDRERASAAAADEARFQQELATNAQITAGREQLAAATAAIQDRDRAQVDALIASTSAGRVQALEQERAAVRAILDSGVLNVQQTEDAKLRILELTLARDLELQQRTVDRAAEIRIAAQERMNGLLELRVTAEARAAAAILRHQELTATLSGDAWGVFSSRFQQEALSWGTTMDRFGQLGADVARDLHTAFEESFFQLMKGNLDDFDDIWKAALDAVLRQIAAFIASEAVQALIKLGKDIVIGITTEGSGGSDFDLFDPDTWFQERRQLEQQTTDESRTRLSLEQQRTDDTRRQVVLMQGPNSVSIGSTGLDFGTKGDMAAAGLRDLRGFLSGGPIGLGLSILNNLNEAHNRYNAGLEATRKSTEENAQVQITAMHALDRNAVASIDLTAATTDLTAAQTDLAIETADVVSGARSATDALAGTVDALDQLGIEAMGTARDITDATNDIVAAGNAAAPGTPGGGPQPGFGPGGGFTGGGPGDPGVETGPSISADGTGPGNGPGGVGPGPGADSPGGGNSGSQQQIRRDARQIREDTEATRQAQRDLTADLERAAAFTAQLDLDITSTAAGTADTAIEAAHFAEALASGTLPASQLQDYFVALSQEHGPAFTQAMIDVLEQLGLSNEQIGAMVEGLGILGEGVEVPVVYTLHTRGTPPPGAGGPSISLPTSDRLHGGWIGVPGYDVGGWVTEGVWGRDSVMAMLARGEFVLNAGAANYAPGFTEALNRDPAKALAGVAGEGDRSGPAIVAALAEQNRLLKRQVELLERATRGPGRSAGAV